MAEEWNFVGHAVRADELDLIRSIVDEFAGLSRVELACTVCELLGWTRATERLKARECRDLLERLQAAGVVTLPAKRIGRPLGACTRVPMTPRGDVQPAVSGTVHDVAPLAIERVTTADDRRLFRELVGRHHYLGAAVPYGAHLRYLVYATRPHPQVVACVQFSSAAWRMAPRDAWIGWDDATRVRHLPQVVNNSRFLVLPWISGRQLDRRGDDHGTGTERPSPARGARAQARVGLSSGTRCRAAVAEAVSDGPGRRETTLD